MTGELDTIGQVRVELAELRGIMTTVVNDHSRRITEVETTTRQLRTDLTVVNDQINNKIATLLEAGNKRGSEMDQRITTNTANILDLKGDVSSVVEKQFGLGQRVATYISPILAIAALIFTFYETIKR